jgi:hypothetical protein
MLANGNGPRGVLLVLLLPPAAGDPFVEGDIGGGGVGSGNTGIVSPPGATTFGLRKADEVEV